MFTKVLIANRGEIAMRIIRTCSRLGIKTVAVYSEADKDAPHTKAATEAYLIGESRVSESYLNIERIIKTAKKQKPTRSTRDMDCYQKTAGSLNAASKKTSCLSDLPLISSQRWAAKLKREKQWRLQVSLWCRAFLNPSEI